MNDPAHRRTRPERALVVGLGSIDRGDDAVGPVVAAMVREELAADGPRGVHVVEHEDPTALIDLMEGFSLVVLADASRSGAPAGTVTVHEVRQGKPALPARARSGPSGTHGLGLAQALELARSLDRLPDRVVVIGIEAAHFEHGRPLSTPVTSAVTTAVDAVLGILRDGTV